MNTTLILLAAVPSTGSMVNLLVIVSIIAIVAWAIIAIIKSSGIAIPAPAWIILSAFAGIALILLIARLFGFITN